MGARGTLVLLVVLAALLAYVAATGGLDSSGVRLTHEPPPLLPTATRTARIEVGGPQGQIALVHGSDGWQTEVGQRPMNDAAQALLETLTTLRPLLVVDAAPGSPADFGLGPGADRLRVIDADQRVLVDLEVGSRNPSWTGVYVRRTGSPEVLLVGGVLRWELAKLIGPAP